MGRPSATSNRLAEVLGFADVPDLEAERSRIADLLEQGAAVSSFDLARAVTRDRGRL